MGIGDLNDKGPEFPVLCKRRYENGHTGGEADRQGRRSGMGESKMDAME